jgi:hypothetical protein
MGKSNRLQDHLVASTFTPPTDIGLSIAGRLSQCVSASSALHFTSERSYLTSTRPLSLGPCRLMWVPSVRVPGLDFLLSVEHLPAETSPRPTDAPA